MLAALVDDPGCVTASPMEKWCKDFDNGGICETVCFHLFDRTPLAFRKIAAWSSAKGIKKDHKSCKTDHYRMRKSLFRVT